MINFFQLEIAQREQRLKDTARYNREVQFMTPILKGFLTEIANEAASYGIQIHGGKGILKEFGVEQLYRDARLYTIYNGPTTLQVNILMNLFMKFIISIFLFLGL